MVQPLARGLHATANAFCLRYIRQSHKDIVLARQAKSYIIEVQVNVQLLGGNNIFLQFMTLQ